ASSSVSDSGGDAEEGAETYTGGEAISPVRFTATSPDGEQVEVQLLGMADIKAKGMTDTAWLPQTRYDEAQEWLDKIVGGEQLTLIEDPASPEDTTEDGALLRYVDSTGTSAQSISGSDNDDVAMGLINLYAGVADNDEKWSGLERYDEYVEASLTAEELNGDLLGENELVAVNEDGSGYEYSKWFAPAPAPHRHRCGAFTFPIGGSVELRACTHVETLERSSCSSAWGSRGIIEARNVSTTSSDRDECRDRPQEPRRAACGDRQAADRARGEGAPGRRAGG